MLQCTVAHVGVPIGAVELPEGRSWAGGILDPVAAFDSLRPVVIAAAHSADVALRILKLPAGEVPYVDDLAPPLAAAVIELARRVFTLHDEAGLAIPATVVRIADPGDGRVRVRAHFRNSFGTVAAAGAPLTRDESQRDDLR